MPAFGFQEPDAEGCKDSKLMTRFRGCVISECKSNVFDTAQVLISRPADEEVLKDVEGTLEEITYTCPLGISALQLSRNAEGAMRQAGFTIVYNGKDGWDNPAVIGSKGGQWIFVRQAPGSNAYTMIAVLQKKMDLEMAVDAEGLAAEIEKSGHVAVYGITFDAGKATLKPEFEAALGGSESALDARRLEDARRRTPTIPAARQPARRCRRSVRQASQHDLLRAESTRPGSAPSGSLLRAIKARR